MQGPVLLCGSCLSGWRCRGRGLVARARVQGRGVASVSLACWARAGRRGAAETDLHFQSRGLCDNSQ